MEDENEMLLHHAMMILEGCFEDAPFRPDEFSHLDLLHAVHEHILRHVSLQGGNPTPYKLSETTNRFVSAWYADKAIEFAARHRFKGARWA